MAWKRALRLWVTRLSVSRLSPAARREKCRLLCSTAGDSDSSLIACSRKPSETCSPAIAARTSRSRWDGPGLSMCTTWVKRRRKAGSISTRLEIQMVGRGLFSSTRVMLDFSVWRREGMKGLNWLSHRQSSASSKTIRVCGSLAMALWQPM